MTKVKAIILIGGVSKGTRFRPLSLDLPKPFFPVAGKPMIHHHLDRLTKMQGVDLVEVLFIGFYEQQALSVLMKRTAQTYHVDVKYLKEPTQMGTAGGLAHFKDKILEGNPDLLLLMHGDICCSFPLEQLVNFHSSRPNAEITMVATHVPNDEASKYGCLHYDSQTHEVVHYAEKPETFISNTINCGIYCLKPSIISKFAEIKAQKKVNTTILDSHEKNPGTIRFEKDILAVLAGSGKLYVYKLKEGNFWQQIKTAGAAIRASELYMEYLYVEQHPELLATSSSAGCSIVGHVVIEETAEIDTSAKIGPNVAIGAGVKIGKGVRISNSIILEGTEIRDNAFISFSIVGWNSTIGRWARVEGAKDFSVFDDDQENKVTILGAGVKIAPEIFIKNCVVLPHKELDASVTGKIIL